MSLSPVFHDFHLYLEDPQNRLTVNAYNQRLIFKKFYQKSIVSRNATSGLAELYMEPATGTVMLRPIYDTTLETTLANTTRSGGSWCEADAVFSGGASASRSLHQYNINATATTVKPNESWYANQCFFIDLHMFGSNDPDWYSVLSFGGTYAIVFNKFGDAVLRTCHRLDTPTDWETIAEGNLTGASGSVFNRDLKLRVFALRNGKVVVSSSEVDGALVGMDPQQREPALDDPHAAPTIFEPTPPELWISGGQYVTAIRPMKFPASGTITTPATTIMPNSPLYGGSGGTEGLAVSELGYLANEGAVSSVLTDAAGNVYGEADEKTTYCVKVTLTAGNNGYSSPHLFFADTELTPSGEIETMTRVDKGPKLQSFTERASVEDGTHEIGLNFVPGQMYDENGWINRHGTLYVGSVGDATLRSHVYTGDPSYSISDNTGKLSFARATTRLDCLKRVLISDAKCFDRMKHTDAVKWALEYAGFGAEDYYLYPDERRLPTSTEDEDPLYRYKNGTTLFDMIRHIIETFSGWMLRERAGILRYEPKPAATTTGVPLFTFKDPDEKRRIMEYNLEVDTSQYYNQIWVVGENDRTKDLLVEFWQDVDAMYHSTPTETVHFPTNVGEKRMLIYTDPALNSRKAVIQTKDIMVAEHGKPRCTVTMKSWYDETIFHGDMIAIELDGPGTDPQPFFIEQIETQVGQMEAFVTYTATYKGPWTTVPRS